MGNLVWDPQQKRYNIEDDDLYAGDETVGALRSAREALPADAAPPALLQGQADAMLQKEAMTGPGMFPGRGFDPGAVIGESLQTAANLPLSVGTGLVDLGLMAVDATRYGLEGFGINNGGFKGGWKEIGNNQDNPLTQARIKYFQPKSGFMKGLNQVGEVVASVVAGPGMLKGALGLATKPGKVLGAAALAADMVESAPGIFQKAGGLADKAQEALSAFGQIQKTGKVTQLGAFASKNRFAVELGKRARSTDALAAQQLDDLISSGGAGRGILPDLVGAAGSTWKTYSALSAPQKLRVAGSVLAQDAFATFMQSGARPLEDESSGLPQYLSEASWVPSYAQAVAKTLVPAEQDAALVNRAKMVAEGSILGFLAQPLIDVGRVAWMARGFGKASKAMQDEIVTILKNGDWSDLATESMLRLPPAEVKLLTSSDPFAKGKPPQPRYDTPIEGQPGGTPHPDGTDFSGPSRSPYGSPPEGLYGELPDLAAYNAGRAPKPAWEGMGATLDDLEAAVTATRSRNEAARAMNETVDEMETIQSAKRLLDPNLPELPPTVRVDTPDPLISPEGIREAVKPELQKYVAQQNPDAEQLTEFLGQTMERAAKLLPPSRKGKTEYFQSFSMRVNGVGVMDPVDAYLWDTTASQSLLEGYGRVDENFRLTMNKSEAEVLDRQDAIFKLAGATDEALLQEQALGGENIEAALQTVDVAAREVEATPGPAQAAGQAPGMPTQVMGKEPAGPSIADRFQAVNDLNLAVDERAQARIQARLDRIRGLVGELDSPLPKVTRARKVRELKKLEGEARQAEAPDQLGQFLEARDVRQVEGVQQAEEMKAQLAEIMAKVDTSTGASKEMYARRAKALVQQLESQAGFDGQGLKVVDEAFDLTENTFVDVTTDPELRQLLDQFDDVANLDPEELKRAKLDYTLEGLARDAKADIADELQCDFTDLT